MFYKLVYKPFIWQKAMESKEHKLQVGSYIFTNEIGSNGNQSFERQYFIFKVMSIHDDYVRLSVVRKLYSSKKRIDGYFSIDKNGYESAKQSIQSSIVTPILSSYIYYNDYILTDSLKIKYPNLSKSRLFVEDVSQNIKPTKESPIYGYKDAYFSLVYSKKEIIDDAKLVPYIYGNSINEDVELIHDYSEKIELIVNKK